jgi:catechol 2,3-dioxygenase-like lactoylglutathione lyase family enzyme
MSKRKGMDLVCINHFTLVAPADTEAAMRKFYGEILGFEELKRPEQLANIAIAWYRAGDLQLHVSFMAKQKADSAELRHVAFEAKNLAALEVHLTAAGIEIEPDLLPIPGMNRFFVHDPSNNLLEILEYTGERPVFVALQS